MEINETIEKVHGTARSKGFWDKPRNVGEMLMLITSELGEAMEAHRGGKFVKIEEMQDAVMLAEDQSAEYPELFKKHVKDTFEDEIADAVIRIFDLCGGLGIDLERHIMMKDMYNETRARLHGKQY